jgi:predicted ATP-grasp superfamily ATP-dependent carboligase
VSARIWVNRARTYKAHLVDMLHDNPDGELVKVFATHPEMGPALAKADVAGSEPDRDASDEEYADWALAYAARNGIDILIPSDRFHALASRQREFENLGVTLLSQPSVTGAAIADSKTATYAAAREAGLFVPQHFQVTDADSFHEAFETIEASGYEVCIKPDTGWAADGFRVLTRHRTGPAELFTAPRRMVHVDDYEAALRQMQNEGQKIQPLIVAPVMDEPEASVDVLRAPTGEIVTTIARVKGRYARTFSTSPQIHHVARTMAVKLDVRYLCNVQTRVLDGEDVLLELNPRASDGLFHCQQTGVNLAWEAVRLAMGKPVREVSPDTSKSLYVIDSVIVG